MFSFWFASCRVRRPICLGMGILVIPWARYSLDKSGHTHVHLLAKWRLKQTKKNKIIKGEYRSKKEVFFFTRPSPRIDGALVHNYIFIVLSLLPVVLRRIEYCHMPKIRNFHFLEFFYNVLRSMHLPPLIANVQITK